MGTKGEKLDIYSHYCVYGIPAIIFGGVINLSYTEISILVN